MKPSKQDEVVFAWIHLSDIHVGHGDVTHGWDQKLVLEAIRADIVDAISTRKVPQPCAVFVTGDIAFSGATRSKDEYDSARTWLLSIGSGAGLRQEDIFVLPGNHDVQRSVDKDDKNTGRLIRALRAGEESIDAVLSDPTDRAHLEKRQANYLAFAKDFAPANRIDHESPASPFFWRHQFRIGADLEVRIAGLNTALLSADDTDHGKLRLGLSQLGHVLLNPPIGERTIVMLLSHHPFRAGWLGDQADVDSWAKSHAHIHLSGHVHEADAEQAISGAGGSFIRVVAGASHGDRSPPSVPASHGYNFAALLRAPNGSIRLAVWPRRWSDKHKRFRSDVDNVPDGETCSVHEIKGVKISPVTPAPAPRKALISILVEMSMTSSFEGRTSLLQGIPAGIGLTRSEGNRLLDLQHIVNGLRDRKLSDGRPCLAVVIDNALSFAAGTDLADALLLERNAIGA